MSLLTWLAQRLIRKKNKIRTERPTGPGYCTCKKYTPISLKKGSINYACSKCGKPPRTMVFGG